MLSIGEENAHFELYFLDLQECACTGAKIERSSSTRAVVPMLFWFQCVSTKWKTDATNAALGVVKQYYTQSNLGVDPEYTKQTFPYGSNIG